MSSGEGRYEWEPADNATPDALYDRTWAITMLNGVLTDLKAEYDERGKKAVFEALLQFVSGTPSASSYAETARLLDTTEGNVKVLVHRLRRHFGETLRERIAETVKSEFEVDEEIRYLMSCFAK